MLLRMTKMFNVSLRPIYYFVYIRIKNNPDLNRLEVGVKTQ